jgi:PUA-like domain
MSPREQSSRSIKPGPSKGPAPPAMSPREQSSRFLTRSNGLPRVVLRKRLGRAIRGGHPWIYRDALTASPRIADGSVVLVAGADGRPLALGFWDATSPIAVRILGAGGALEVEREIERRV